MATASSCRVLKLPDRKHLTPSLRLPIIYPNKKWHPRPVSTKPSSFTQPTLTGFPRAASNITTTASTGSDASRISKKPPLAKSKSNSGGLQRPGAN